MSLSDVVAFNTLARSRGARLVGWALGAFVAALALYAGWRGYQNPDFLLRIAAAFGLC